VLLYRPGRSRGDEPGFEAIGGCVHKRRPLNTRLSSGTSAGTFAVSAGPYRNYRVVAGTKNEPDMFFVPVQKKGWKIDPHVSNLRSRDFHFQGVSCPTLMVQTQRKLEVIASHKLSRTISNFELRMLAARECFGRGAGCPGPFQARGRMRRDCFYQPVGYVCPRHQHNPTGRLCH